MNPDTLTPPKTSPDERIRRIAKIVRALAVIGAVALVANSVFTWFSPDYALQRIRTETGVLDKIHELSLRARVLYAFWDAATVSVTLMALYRLWQLFGEYMQARIFGARALACLRGFARWMLAAAIISPIYSSVLCVIATWDNGPGKREINFQITSDDYTTLLFGLVVLAISSVMAEAARIAEDNEGFV
jgi:hypothetical protein